jgi:lipopolysaccharide exporter
MSSGLTGAVARGTIWIGLARIGVNLMGFAGLIVLARLLTPDDFGVVAIATSLFVIISAATNLSAAQALVQHHAPENAHFNTAFTLNLMRGLIVFALLAALAYPAGWVFDEPRLVVLMPIFGASALVTGLQNPRMIIFLRNLDFRQQFQVQVAEKLVTVLASVVAAVLTQSYWSLVVGIIAGQLCTLALSYVLLPCWPRLSLSRFREIVSFSIWLTLSQVLNMINWRFDQLLIGRNIGREALGHYAVGDNLASLPTREVTAPLFATLFPGFARIHQEPERLRRAYQRAQAFIVALTLPAGIGVALLADPLVRLFLGNPWLPSIIVIQGLAAIFALQMIGALADPLAMAKGQTRVLFVRDMQNFAIRIPLILAGLHFGGFAGVVYARVLSGTMGIGLNIDIVRRIAGISWRSQLAGPLRSLISAAAMTAAVLAIGGLVDPGQDSISLAAEIALKAAVGAAVYVACHILLWLVAGRPDGPERELLNVSRTILTHQRAERVTPAE